MRVTSHTHLAIATLIIAFAFTCYGASVSEPNEPSAEKASPREVSSHAQNDSGAIRAAKAELQAEMYKDSADSLKWALSIIIGLVIIFIGYALFKNTREYRQALADVKGALSEAREASKEARDASDKARGWEEKAREKLASIDEKVETKLKQIEAKGKASITDLTQEGEKQRKTSELFRKGLTSLESEDYKLAADYFDQVSKIDPRNAAALNNWGAALVGLGRTKEGDEACNLFNQGCVALEKAVKLKPNYAEAYSNWATALVDLARTKVDDEASNLLREACEKYVKAIKIKPSYAEAYSNWGAALGNLARTKQGNEAFNFLSQACEKCEKAIKIKPNYAEAYNNWGSALSERAKRKEGDEADNLFTQACEKYKKAAALKPSYFEAWDNWGATLLHQARIKTGKERKNLVDEAKDKSLKAESIKTGSGAYNLACAHTLLGEEKECQNWLKTGEKAGTLPTREHAMADVDLKSVRDKAWFKQLRWSAAPK